MSKQTKTLYFIDYKDSYKKINMFYSFLALNLFSQFMLKLKIFLSKFFFYMSAIF